MKAYNKDRYQYKGGKAEPIQKHEECEFLYNSCFLFFCLFMDFKISGGCMWPKFLDCMNCNLALCILKSFNQAHLLVFGIVHHQVR